MTELGPGQPPHAPDARQQPHPGQQPYAGHWQYQDPYAAPAVAPPAFPYAASPPPVPPYPGSPWAPPMMAMPPLYVLAPPSNGLATAAMVLGIISIPGAILSFVDLPIALVGLILGFVGLSRANRLPRLLQIGKGKAIAGIARASVGLVLSASFSAYLISEFARCSDYATDSQAWDDCFAGVPQ